MAGGWVGFVSVWEKHFAWFCVIVVVVDYSTHCVLIREDSAQSSFRMSVTSGVEYMSSGNSKWDPDGAGAGAEQEGSCREVLPCMAPQ